MAAASIGTCHWFHSGPDLVASSTLMLVARVALAGARSRCRCASCGTQHARTRDPARPRRGLTELGGSPRRLAPITVTTC